MKNFKIKILLLLVIVITFVAFSPCLKNGFVNFDDSIYITQNPTVRDLSIGGISKIFTTAQYGLYNPLVFLSFAFEYRFFKLNPVVYHTTNLVFHLFNVMLVFWLFFLLTRKIGVAFIVSLLFGIHPLHVESVAWITERKDMLYSFLFLGAVISYVYYLKKSKIKFYYLCLLLFILSLLAKPMGITLPFLLLLLDYFFNVKYDKNNSAQKIPFVIIAAIASMESILINGKLDLKYGLSYNLFDNFLIAAHGLLFYIYKLFLPINLSCFYPYPQKNGNLLPLEFLLSPIGVVLFITIMVVSFRQSKKIFFGLGFFLITILPVLQFIPVGPVIAADRYTYIPTLGIFYLISVGLFWVYARKIKNSIFLKNLFIAILIATTSTLMLLTWKRCQVWKDSTVLWSDVLKKYPNVATAYNSRGAELLIKKEYAKAFFDFRRAINFDPIYYEAYFNLGSLYDDLGKYTEATKFVLKTLQIDPSYFKAYDLLCVLYGKMGKHSEVIEICKQLIKIKADSAMTYNNLCSAYGNLGNFKEAVASCQKALEIDPDLALIHYNLSVAYYFEKQYALAIEHCERGIELGYVVAPKFLELLKPYKK